MTDSPSDSELKRHQAIAQAFKDFLSEPVEWRAAALRFASTTLLLEQIEAYRWSIAIAEQDVEDGDPHAAQSIAFCRAMIQPIAYELNKRRKAAERKSAPHWPDTPIDPKDELDEIKRRLPIVELIRRFGNVELVKAGRNFKCRCILPGHDDRTPSMVVYPEKNRFWCYGCTRGGDVIDFAKFYLNRPLPEVVVELRLEAGMGPRPDPKIASNGHATDSATSATLPQEPRSSATGMWTHDGRFVDVAVPMRRHKNGFHG